MSTEDTTSQNVIANDGNEAESPFEVVWMKDRRPLSPNVANSKELRSSYFSDKIPLNLRREKTLEELQILNLGEYSGSICELVRFLTFREEFCGVYSLGYSTDGSQLVLGLGNGEVQIYDRTNNKLKKVVSSSLANHPTTCVKFHPLFPELFFAGSTSGYVTLNNTEGENKISIAEQGNEVNTLDTDTNGVKLITAGKDACIRMYDTVSKQVVQVFGNIDPMMSSTIDYHRMRIYCLKYHPTEDSVFMSGGWDGTVKIWDVRTEDGLVRNIEGPFISGDAIDCKSNKILTGSNRCINNLQLWDFGSGLLIKNIIPTNRLVTLEGDCLYTAKFFSGESAGDLIMCGGGGYGGLRIISLKENLVVGVIPEKKPIITSTCFENEICYGAKSGNCQLVKYLIGGKKEEEVVEAINKEMENAVDEEIDNAIEKEIENSTNKGKEMDVTTFVSEEPREATVPEEQRTVDEK